MTLVKAVAIAYILNPIQDRGAERHPTSFFPVTSTNVGISP